MRDELAAELSRFRGPAALRDDQAFLILAEEPGANAGAEWRTAMTALEPGREAPAPMAVSEPVAEPAPRQASAQFSAA
jgi:hypothetical protein